MERGAAPVIEFGDIDATCADIEAWEEADRDLARAGLDASARERLWSQLTPGDERAGVALVDQVAAEQNCSMEDAYRALWALNGVTI